MPHLTIADRIRRHPGLALLIAAVAAVLAVSLLSPGRAAGAGVPIETAPAATQKRAKQPRWTPRRRS